MVKTRLTKDRGGNLTSEEAAEFYRCCLLDTADLAMLALSDLDDQNLRERADDPSAPLRIYDFFISTTPEDSLDRMRAIFATEDTWDRPISYLCDHGASFDGHFNDAFQQLFDQGYDTVVVIGGDQPTMTREHISEAFQWLDYFARTHEQGYGFVQAPCQESGVSLVGRTRSTPVFAEGVFYNMTGRPAIDGYVEMLQQYKIPNALLHSIADVDNDSDLAHTISCVNAMAEASLYQTGLFVPLRVLEWIERMGLQASSPPNEDRDPREHIDVAVD